MNADFVKCSPEILVGAITLMKIHPDLMLEDAVLLYELHGPEEDNEITPIEDRTESTPAPGW